MKLGYATGRSIPSKWLVIVMLKIIIIIMIRSSQKQVRSVPIFKLEEDCPHMRKGKRSLKKLQDNLGWKGNNH